jgi:hypothetical protein
MCLAAMVGREAPLTAVWWLLAMPVVAGAQAPQHVPISVGTISLSRNASGFVLEDAASGKRLPVPEEWLEPREERGRESDAYVSSFEWDDAVTIVRIGGGKIALQLSSYDIATEGSSGAAAGRDAFLVADAAFTRIAPGLVDLGITKSRVRDQGCFAATATRFSVADVGGGAELDIGVEREEVECKAVAREGGDVAERQHYVRRPVRWYVFDGDAWVYDPALDGRPPSGPAWELPLIGLVKSPVEFVMERRGR